MKKSDFENKFMKLAFQEAEKAFRKGEVPVGCVIIGREGQLISKAGNLMQQQKNPNAHAEILAIDFACRKLESKSLAGCDIYITLEPCVMCAAAIANARIDRLYYAAADAKQGAVENGLRFFTSASCFHRPEIYPGLSDEEPTQAMKSFFRKIRQQPSRKSRFSPDRADSRKLANL